MMKVTYLGQQGWAVASGRDFVLIDPVLPDWFGTTAKLRFQIWPPLQVIIEKMPELSAVIITNEHLDHFNLRSLLMLPKHTKVYMGNMMMSCCVEAAERAGMSVTLLADKQPLVLSDLHIRLYLCAPESAAWEKRVYHAVIESASSQQSTLIQSDGLLSPDLVADLAAGEIKPVSLFIATNNAQIVPTGASGTYDNLLPVGKPDNEGPFGLRVFHEILCRVPDELGYVPHLAFCGGGYLQSPPKHGPFLLSDAAQLKQNLSVLALAQKVHCPVPGETYALHKRSQGIHVETEHAPWIVRSEYLPEEASSNMPRTTSSAIVLDASWDIYDGSLSANVDPDGRHPETVLALMVGLRLHEEFKSTGPGMWLQGGGGNVSAGQKLRILLARAFLQAIDEKKRMIVHDSLASLDAGSIHRVLCVARHYSIDVDWTPEALIRMESASRSESVPDLDALTVKAKGQRDKEPKHVHTADGSESSKLWRTILVRTPPVALLYLLPTVGVAMLSRMVNGVEHLSADAFAPRFFLVTLLAFMLAVSTSFLIECTLRLHAARQHASLLKRVTGFSAEDFLQRLSRDYSTVVGRLTYYLNDITWIFAGILVSFGALVGGFGFYGLGIAGAFTLSCGAIWLSLASLVVNARRKMPIGINTFLVQTENLKRLGGLPLSTASQLKRLYVDSGLEALWRTQAASLASKAALCYYIHLASVATLFLVCAIGPIVATEASDYLGELNTDWWSTLLEIVAKGVSSGALIVMLDEVLSTLPVGEARQALAALHSLASETRSIVILVDHRFTWGEPVHMAALDIKSPALSPEIC